MKTPLVSVIVPVYNIEAYLTQAIESVTRQSIGFEDSIELILVDDGSTDGSAEVCQEYARRYPDNVKYIRQENSGVSKTRNNGLKAATGQYVHFFDGDDELSKDFYQSLLAFLKQHDDVEFAAAKLMLFDADISSHPLNYKFGRTRVIDLAAEPDAPIIHIVTCLFRTESLAGKQFDEQLSISEDMKLLSDVLAKTRRYGVVTRPTYYYRKRSTGGSAIGSKEKNKSYYLETPVRAYRHMLDAWQKTGDTTPIEYTLLYDLSYRLSQKSAPVLNEDERAQYVSAIEDVLKRMSVQAVSEHRFLSVQAKLYILGLLYGNRLDEALRVKNGVLHCDDMPLYDYNKAAAFVDFFREIAPGEYKIEGYIAGVFRPDDYALVVNGKQVPLTKVPRAQREHSFMGYIYDDGGAFEATVHMQPGSKLTLEARVDGVRRAVRLKTGVFTRLAYAFSYRCDERAIVQNTPRSLRVKRRSWWRHALLEARQVGMILLDWKLGRAVEQFGKMTRRNFAQLSKKAALFEVLKPVLIVAEAVAMIPRALLLRAAYYLCKPLLGRPVWIVSDRGLAAGDNGEAFFRYVMKRSDRKAKVYFAISKKSPDYARMKSIGSVLDYGGLYYKLQFLLADKIISSHADIEVTNPFLRQANHYADLFDFDFVFLQHGVIRNDLSGWLNRFEKNIALFITSARKEYDSILDYPYYYEPKNVLLSGMPRYDQLENTASEKKIVIAPTYRKSLLRLKTDKYGIRPYDDQFKRSRYYEFYSQLIADERLREAMRKSGVAGEFYIHPNFAPQIPDFASNDEFVVQPYPYDYKNAISGGSLLVSDFSSIVLDFAYLKKPVVYTHFDADTFFEGHSYDKGDFFSDEKDGFGPVTATYNELVDAIIERIEADFAMEAKYRKRVDAFFAYGDKNNSERVYERLVSASLYNKAK